MNNYRIISDIGSGAYSTVHKAIDINTGHIVAIKKISDQNMNIKHIINRQVAILHECINHPNIIQLYKCFSLGNFTYLIFQYMPMDLISYYKSVQQSKKRNLTDEEICYIAYQLCNALNFLHKKRIMHRDIKPQNILIDPENLTIKLIDFGFAKQSNVPGNPNTNYMVTRWYRPLQIVLNLPYNQKVDIFATGALILELYLGHQIFRSTSNLDQLYWIINICGFPYNWKQAINELTKLGANIEQLSSTKPNSDSSINTNSKNNSFASLRQLTKDIRPLATDLIAKMLKTSPQQRIDIHQAYQHPYFSRYKVRNNIIANNKRSNAIDNSINGIDKENTAKVIPLIKTNRAFSTQQLPQLDNMMLTYREGGTYYQGKNKIGSKQQKKMNQSFGYRKNGTFSDNQMNNSVKKQKQESISGVFNCQLLPSSRGNKISNENMKKQNFSQNQMIHKSQYTMNLTGNKNSQYQNYLIKRKSSTDKNNQYIISNQNYQRQNTTSKNKDPLSYTKLVNQKSKPLESTNARPTVRNRVKSLNQQGINVISLKKLKVHRQIDNVKSREKINQYKEIQKSKQKQKDAYSNMIRLQPRREKDKPMFMKVKDKINQGKLNQRGSEQKMIQVYSNSGYNNLGGSGMKGNSQKYSNNMVLKTQGSQPTKTEISTKLASSASMKMKKMPQYKQYMFASKNI